VTEPADMDIAAAAKRLAEGELTAVELLESCLDRIVRVDPQLGAIVTLDEDRARADARASDDRRLAGQTRGRLDGIPVGIKDIIADATLPMRAQSRTALDDWDGVGRDAASTGALKAAGAVVIATLATMEFAIGMPEATGPFAVPVNPWNPERWTGGSSSGSAAAVSAGMVLGALGTDTGGSVRAPAAFTGTTALKPTRDLVDTAGVFPLSFSLDHVGPMARTAEDCAIMLEALTGERFDLLRGDLRGVRIAADSLDRYAERSDPATRERFSDALRTLSDAGAEVITVHLPLYDELSAAANIIQLSEALSVHRHRLDRSWNDLSPSARIVFAAADSISASDYVQAQRVRTMAAKRYDGVFSEYDLVVTPTSHLTAPRLSDLDPLRPLSPITSMHTAMWSPLGVPVAAVPMGFGDDQLPLSLAIAGGSWRDRLVLDAGHALQLRTPHHLARPTLPFAEGITS